MPHKSPFGKEIGEEWERLVFGIEDHLRLEREPPAEQVHGWRRLYERAYQNGEWNVCGPDASLIASLGTTIAFRKRRYADAAVLAEQYFDHPDAASDDSAWEHLTAELATNLLLSGRVEEGLSRFQALLDRDGYGHQSRLVQVRNHIQVVLDEWSKGDSLDSHLARFTATLLEVWKGHKSKARRALECRTNGDLLRLLEETYPKRKPEETL